MKYAFMSYSFPDQTFEQLLASAQHFGYDGVEPRIGSGHRHGLELDLDRAGRLRAKEQAKQAGVAVCGIATSSRFADPEKVNDAVRDTHAAIDLAADVGAPCVRVFGGVIGNGLSRDDAIGLIVEAMQGLKDHAAEAGVVLSLETHDDWCNTADMARLVQAIDHDAVRVTWDLMHPVFSAGETMDAAFARLRPWIAHVHCHDCRRENDQRVLVPIGEGMIDHGRAIELLHEMNYDGFISGEWIRWQPGELHLPRELSTLKRYEMELVG